VPFRFSHLPISRLLLDPNNYRVQESTDYVRADPARFAEDIVQQRAAQRLRDPSLQALKSSILRNGFLEFEPLIVRQFADEVDPKYIVLDGNRRLSALRWIQQDSEAGVNIPENVLHSLENVPVVIVDEDEQDPALYEALMGVRHVSGIKEWGGYQRAKLIATLREDRGLDASEVSERLGLSTLEVNRRLRAYKALEQMKRSEEFGAYAKPEMYPLFHEAVAQPLVRDWLNWNDEARRFENEEELAKFYALLTPSETDDGENQLERPPKIQTYSQVRDLRDILGHPEAKQNLLDTEESLAAALAVAKRDELSRAWVSQMNNALIALRNMSIDELKGATPDDLAELAALRDLCITRIDERERLVAE
jgi:hypothetical protein